MPPHDLAREICERMGLVMECCESEEGAGKEGARGEGARGEWVGEKREERQGRGGAGEKREEPRRRSGG